MFVVNLHLSDVRCYQLLPVIKLMDATCWNFLKKMIGPRKTLFRTMSLRTMRLINIVKVGCFVFVDVMTQWS